MSTHRLATASCALGMLTYALFSTVANDVTADGAEYPPATIATPDAVECPEGDEPGPGEHESVADHRDSR